MQGVNPIDWRHASLKEKRAHDIINSAKSAFGFTILLGGVRTRHAKDGAMGEEERAGRGVIKLTAVVALDSLHGSAKLSTHVGKKVRNSGKSVGFKVKQKCPSIMKKIINNYKIIFVTGHTSNGRCPKITIY
jgi:hypothetical protein